MIDKVGILSRIKQAMKLNSDADLARFLGVSPATLSNWRARGSIDYDLVFSKCEGISMDWLLTGQGLIRQQKESTRPSQARVEPIKEVAPNVPVLSVRQDIPKHTPPAPTTAAAPAPTEASTVSDAAREIAFYKGLLADRERTIEIKDKKIDQLNREVGAWEARAAQTSEGRGERPSPRAPKPSSRDNVGGAAGKPPVKTPVQTPVPPIATLQGSHKYGESTADRP